MKWLCVWFFYILVTFLNYIHVKLINLLKQIDLESEIGQTA